MVSLVMANVPLASLRSIFITHHHSDHNADYGNLMLLAWTAGLSQRVDTWGPPPLRQMTRLFFEMNAYDIKTRIADEGRPPLAPLVHAHDLHSAGVVMQDENVKVTAALVHHPPVSPAFGYRFDSADRSIVISGGTTPTKSLVDLARGADVLVHEALFEPGIDRMVARVANASSLKRSILSHHTTAEDAGRVDGNIDLHSMRLVEPASVNRSAADHGPVFAARRSAPRGVRTDPTTGHRDGRQ
jgi:ribonuclease BN (tRNA processing enzyme)